MKLKKKTAAVNYQNEAHYLSLLSQPETQKEYTSHKGFLLFLTCPVLELFNDRERSSQAVYMRQFSLTIYGLHGNSSNKITATEGSEIREQTVFHCVGVNFPFT